MAGMFGSGPQSNILQTVQSSYGAILNAEKQKGASMREAMGAFGKAIDPKTIGLNAFKKKFADADWTKPETYMEAGKFMTEFAPEEGIQLTQQGMQLAASLKPKTDKQIITIYDDQGNPSQKVIDLNQTEAGTVLGGAKPVEVNRKVVTLNEKGVNVLYSINPKDPTDKIKIGTAKVTGPSTIVNVGDNTAAKELAKDNVASLTELGDSSEFRAGNIVDAKKFIAGYKAAIAGKSTGEGAIYSGLARKGLSLIPISITKQSQLDEQLDSMAEQAARAKLKSLGEIRPTDADVKGMKESLFGIGRSEETNVKLLTQYLAELEKTEAKYQGLLYAQNKGNLESFVLDASTSVIGPTEIDPSIISSMFSGVLPSSDLFGRLYEGLTNQQKRIYADSLK